MAGQLKPDDQMLIDGGVESTRYQLGEHNLTGGFYPEYLFDGTTGNACSVNHGCFFIITFYENINIYRCGGPSFNDTGAFIIYKKNDINNDFIDITKDIKQNISRLGENMWQLYIENLQKGTYKFEIPAKGATQGTAEWFLEKAYPKILLEENNNYYSVLADNYNINTHSYNPVTINSFSEKKFNIRKLFEEITIAQETFRPIDKFTNFKILLDELYSVSITAIKSSRELIISNDDIDISISSFIHYFHLNYLCKQNGAVKIAISYDQGKTWYTWKNSAFNLLPVNIPCKPCHTLDKQELTQWNQAKDCIYNHGIDKDALYHINLNPILSISKKIRFAYVIDRPSTADTAHVNNLIWNFDAKGHLDKMKDSEYNVSIYDHSAKITSLIENALLKVNIMI